MTPGYWLEGTAGAAGRYVLTVFRTCKLQNAECAPPAAGVNESSPARFASAALYAAELDKHDFRYDVQVSQHTRLTHKWTRGVDGAAAVALHRYPGARAAPLEGKVLVFGGGAPAAVFDPTGEAPPSCRIILYIVRPHVGPRLTHGNSVNRASQPLLLGSSKTKP
jgi:hypothetical protein